MTEGIYDRLADALHRLPNGFTRTASRAEIPLLQRMFTPEEAEIGAQLGREMEPVEEIAARLGMEPLPTRKRLMDMARKGLVWFERGEGKIRFRLAPFVVGSYEAQLDVMDNELAHLFEAYLAAGGAADIMRPQPALTRVIPVQSAVKAEEILPYDDVRAILMRAKTVRIQDCICRLQQEHLGRRCDFPLRVCLTFSNAESTTPHPNAITREEALALLDEVEEIGLVHSVSNVMEGLGFICNCCGCCCGVLRSINEFGVERSIARSNYDAVIDADACTGCGVCVERCQVHAIALDGGVAAVDLARCIGCGLCVSGCEFGAASLRRKAPEEIVPPPPNMTAWEEERLRRRTMP